VAVIREALVKPYEDEEKKKEGKRSNTLIAPNCSKVEEEEGQKERK